MKVLFPFRGDNGHRTNFNRLVTDSIHAIRQDYAFARNKSGIAVVNKKGGLLQKIERFNKNIFEKKVTMRKLFFILLMSAFGILSAQNLFRDPDFDKGSLSECIFDCYSGTAKYGIITEDLTWNKCLRVENIKHRVDPKTGKKATLIVCWLGKEGKLSGFKVEPDAVYEFQFECKGTYVPRVKYSEWSGPKFWKDMKTKKANIAVKPVVSDSWTVVKGTFKTSAKAQRAALHLEMSGREEWKNPVPVGAYFMIDKVKIEKKKSLLPSVGTIQVSEKKIQVPCIVAGKTYSGFVLLKKTQHAKAQTSYTCTMQDGKLIVDIRCMEPKMDNLAAKAIQDGGQVWSDDCVEIFFGSNDPKKRTNHFAVSASGARWMDKKDGYEKWTAKVTKETDSWSVHCEFPVSSLGWDKEPATDETILLFIARERIAEKELSSSAPVKNGFQEKKSWPIFFPHGLQAWFDAAKADLLKETSGNADLNAQIKDWTMTGVPEKDLAKAKYFRDCLTKAKLAGRRFVVTLNSITTDPEIPFLPAALAEPQKKISCRAAGNDTVFVPLAITNITSRAEEYRIVVSALDIHSREKNQLETADGKVFPTDQVKLFRGIRVKDGNEENHGYRYDPLAPMDLTQTVVIPARESAPVWIRFQTKNVSPGVYKGTVRVIPLGEYGNKNKKKLSYRDIPFSFEVVPFELGTEFPTHHFNFQVAHSKENFKQMLESHVNVFQVSPYNVSLTFNKKGEIVKKNMAGLEKCIRRYQGWAKEFHAENEVYFCISYGVYLHYMNIHAKKELKPFTPAWEKGWIAYMKELDNVRVKCGIPQDRWSLEICDEPQKNILPELIKASELAVKAIPELRFDLTILDRGFSADELQKMVPYIYEWCWWGNGCFTSGKNKGLFQAIRAKGAQISTYSCSTSMREHLQKYYRCLAWNVPCYDLQGCNMYQHTTYLYKDRDWKQAACGELALMVGPHAVTTIRGECLNAGINDLRYYAKLKEVSERVDKNSALGKEVRDFLEKTPRRLLRDAADNASCCDEAREKMIDLILKVRPVQ